MTSSNLICVVHVISVIGFPHGSPNKIDIQHITQHKDDRFLVQNVRGFFTLTFVHFRLGIFHTFGCSNNYAVMRMTFDSYPGFELMDIEM